MSAAELQAHQIIMTHHLYDLPEDVKQHMIIMLGNAKQPVEHDYLSFESINSRLDTSEIDIALDNGVSAEEVHSMWESKYPWLCE